jgi:hypothetical protein
MIILYSHAHDLSMRGLSRGKYLFNEGILYSRSKRLRSEDDAGHLRGKSCTHTALQKTHAREQPPLRNLIGLVVLEANLKRR